MNYRKLLEEKISPLETNFNWELEFSDKTTLRLDQVFEKSRRYILTDSNQKIRYWFSIRNWGGRLKEAESMKEEIGEVVDGLLCNNFVDGSKEETKNFVLAWLHKRHTKARYVWEREDEEIPTTYGSWVALREKKPKRA